MSWLNLNESLNSLKGQITNFASEVLSEGVVQDSGDSSAGLDPSVKQLEEKCHNQQLEIAALKKLNEELQATLQSERLSRRNGVKEEESSWYWDPPQPSNSNSEIELYKQQIQNLRDEISTLKERGIGTQPEIEEEVIRLREENKNLTTNLEDLDTQHQLAMERLLTLKKELQKNFEVLKQEHEDLKNSNDEYAAEIQSLLVKIGERDEEIKHWKSGKSDLETIQHKYMNLEKVHSLLKENVEKFQEENQELHEEVFKLQEQVTKLEHELEIATKHAELSNAVPRERYEELLKELTDLKERRKTSQIHLDEINIDDNAKSVIENLKRDIKELKHKLAQKEETHSDNKPVQCDKIIQLYNKYVNFDLPVDYVGEIPSSDDNIFMFKLEAVFKTLNSYKKDINALEHKLSEKNHDINHMQTQIDDLTAENEFLTTDVHHFESELNEMKKNNDFLISEIAALKNVSKLEPIIETHEDNLATLETELADSNRINKTFESEIRRIEKELAEVQGEKKILKESLNDLRSKYTAMLEELETCKTETKIVSEMEETANADQTEYLRKASDEIDELKKRLSSAHAKNEQLSIDVHIIENDKVLLTKEVDDLKRALEQKNATHDELETVKLSLNNKLQELELRLDDISKHKEKIESEKFELEKKFTVLENEISVKSNSAEIAAKLQTATTEKEQLLQKLGHIQIENSTLQQTVEILKKEISNLRKTDEDLLNENNSLKNCTAAESENSKVTQQTINELKAKIIEQEILNNEISTLRDEKLKIHERKLQLEGELSATDNKIMHLEEDFEKLVHELNEKDIIIDTLNNTAAKNNKTIAELSQNVTDLSNSSEIKNQEIQRLNASLKEAMEKLNVISYNSDKGFEELQKLQSENQEISKQILVLNEELGSKNIHISALTNRVEELDKKCTDYKTAIDVKDREIKELNQSIVELTDKVKSAVSVPHHNDDYAKLVQEKEAFEDEIITLRSNVTDKEKELSEMKTKSEQLEKTCLEYKTIIDNSTKEKAELINFVNIKHSESIQYHNEIQRLNQVLLEQTDEFKRVIEEKDNLIQNHSENCANCERLKMNLQEKDIVIMTLNQKTLEYDRIKAELQTASDTIRNLTEKCESLDKSLSVQLEAVKNLTTENAELSEVEQNSTRELERLRHHLVELEENYTQELMTSEQKLTECQARLHQVEERAKQTSTVYTSNSIRANQEVETLRNQIKLLEKQREDVQAKLSEAEDARSRSEAALTNLQVVLEQFQLDKERDIHAATEKVRNKMEDLKRENNGLREEIAKLNAKLEESLAGLQAATRLGDQVETKTAQINDLKEQVRTLQTSVAAAEERYYNAISNQQDRVDKNLVKNLVVNYVTTAGQNTTNKTQVLRVLSTVLDFNQQECERLGLARAASNTDSLAAEFVKFLQNESQPRAPPPTLPDIMGLTLTQGSRSTTPSSRKSSVAGSNPDVGHKRNPSTGSNNLLFQNLDTVETTSQISMDLGVNQTRDNEGAILKHVLRDM